MGQVVQTALSYLLFVQAFDQFIYRLNYKFRNIKFIEISSRLMSYQQTGPRIT